MRYRELREYEDLNQEKQKIIQTISGLAAEDDDQAALLDRIWKLLNTETVTNNITNSFMEPMKDEFMSDKVKDLHRLEITKILSQLDSDYKAMDGFLKKLERGGVVNIDALKQPINSFNAIFDGDGIAIKAFDALKMYGVGQNQKGPGEFALAVLSNKIRLAQGEGDTEIDGIGKVEVKAAVGSSGAGGRLGHGGASQSSQMRILETFQDLIPNTIARITNSISITEFVKSMNSELPATGPDGSKNASDRERIARALFTPNFSGYAAPIAAAFRQEDPEVIIAAYVEQNFEWYKNRDNFDAYLCISFTRQKTAMGTTGKDIVNLRKAGQITGFGISVIPTKAGPREQFAQISMSASGI